MSKQKIVIFGAGMGGKRAYKSLRKEYDIIAFVDNDQAKHGSQLLKLPIKAPSDLAKLDYDQIYIASMYAAEITYQLRQELDVPIEKIAQVDKGVLNGDEEVPWGCLGIIVAALVLIGWGVYALFF
jgi:FlaA1/EpsC-like NDP-sugar epimerase